MALNYLQLKELVDSNKKKIRNRQAPDGVETCVDCDVPLMEAVTGNRSLQDGSHVCSDCYFERWGKEIDEYPLYPPRFVRRKKV